MKSLFPAAAIGVAAALSWGAASAEPLKVQIHGVERASFTDSSGQLRGKHHGGQRAMLVELTRELMMQLELEPSIEQVAQQQGIKALDGSTAVALVDVSQQQTQSPRQWVGPLQDNNVYLFESKDHPSSIQQLEQAKSVDSICVRSGNGHQQLLESLGFNNIRAEGSYKVCWDLLAAGEVSLATLNQTLIPTVLESDPVASKQLRNTGVAVQKQPVYIGFSAAIPATEVQRWQQQLEQFKASLDYQGLVHHYYCQQDCF
ncbi:hypothetical protein [Motiliproteus sp.]|uniref:hypothetical protein n=1 Tax=Motiliproteus sp. TaxID=1898955 RepID=UPI003BAA58F6